MSDFENDIKNLFEDAVFEPSERVWNGVEAALKAKKKKKGIFFMWQTYGVAAGLSLLLTIGLLWQNGVFNANDPNTKTLTENTEKENDSINEEGKEPKVDSDKPKEELNVEQESGKDEIIAEPSTVQKLVADNADAIENSESISILVADNFDAQSSTEELQTVEIKNPVEVAQDVLSDQTLFDALIKPYRPSLAAEKSAWLARINFVPMSEGSDEKGAEELIENTFEPQRRLIGGLGSSVLTGGAFSEDNALLADVQTEDDSGVQLSKAASSGPEEAVGAINAGFGFGLDLSKKLTLNLGLRYSEFKFRSTSNAYIVDGGASLPVYAPLGIDTGNAIFAGDYNVSNTLSTLLMQSLLEYRVVSFGKFDVAIKAGVGLDYFLSYRIKGDLNFLSPRRVNPGDTDLYNQLNFSGITGLGINYRINNQVGIAADLNYRRFLSSQQSNNTVLGFGLSLNYFLNRRKKN